MKRAGANQLGKTLSSFFTSYLPSIRGLSVHTVRSYRDSLMLFLKFSAEQEQRDVIALDMNILSADNVMDFLTDLEATRHSSVATRNARLAALHTFCRFAATQAPDHSAGLQSVLGVPFKRGVERRPIEHLTKPEVSALLTPPPNPSASTERDIALFTLLVNTGARIQEALDLRVSDTRLDRPHQVTVRGKGKKIRVCPIWPRTATRLRRMMAASKWPEAPDRFLFLNQRGEKLTRHGARAILVKHIERCSLTVPSLRHRRIHPHVLRHTAAVEMLNAGIDFATIAQLLGHASPATTMIYATADIELKRKALAQLFPGAPRPPKGGKVRSELLDIVSFLRKL